MLTFLAALGAAFGAIFLAEFGDKSQLLILAFATRVPWRPIVVGLVVAAASIQGLSVLVGAAVGAALTAAAVSLVAGIAFLAVAAWTLRGDDGDETMPAGPRAAGRGTLAVVGVVAGAFIVAELGDKTMLATFALAASQGALPTWIGSTAGEVAANLVAVVLGRQVGRRLSPRLLRVGSAALFALAGLVILASAVASWLGPGSS
jgi:putative Ca2+/H+ antiporter (TMEM165/GDT1 family)